MDNKADIGLIGLAVMGENLVLNMESRGFTVAVFNRTTQKVDDFVNGRGKGKNFIGVHSVEELVKSLKRPRKVMMLVKAGKPVDDFIDQLLPHLEPGDIIIDGGNTHYPDTIRRAKLVESKGMLYVGTGVSGGEEGALKGPSMMPGGSVAGGSFAPPISAPPPAGGVSDAGESGPAPPGEPTSAGSPGSTSSVRPIWTSGSVLGASFCGRPSAGSGNESCDCCSQPPSTSQLELINIIASDLRMISPCVLSWPPTSCRMRAISVPREMLR